MPQATENTIDWGQDVVFVGEGSPAPDVGGVIVGGYDYTFTVEPGEIIAAQDQDRPNLSGVNKTPLPGASQTHVIFGTDLSKGADRRWDASRQLRVRIRNPHSYPPAVLPHVGGHLWDDQPVADSVPEEYPSDNVLGNDDTGTEDSEEDNDPYGGNGKITAKDAPTMAMPNSTGTDGDVFEIRTHFLEFLRLNIGDAWFRISDDYPWRVHFKFKRENGKWRNDTSTQAQDNQGF